MKPRRKYERGTCQDCGKETQVTIITFWVNGMRYKVCSTCIKPYRNRILVGR